MLSKLANVKQKTLNGTTFGAALGWIAVWVWTIAAGGGGLWLLDERAMAADKWLVRAVFGDCSMSGNELAL